MRFNKNKSQEKLKSKNERAYDTAIDTRKFEIGLFWSRSIFFWGFIGAALVAYGVFLKEDSEMSTVIAFFGFVCSVAWTLVNRGSKYWQESWEEKVKRLEKNVTGELFAKWEDVQTHKFFWLRARKYSVSKLAIALSDYTILLWIALILWDQQHIFPHPVSVLINQYGVIGFACASTGYCALLIIFGRTSKNKEELAEQGGHAVLHDLPQDTKTDNKFDPIMKEIFDYVKNVGACGVLLIGARAIVQNHDQFGMPIAVTIGISLAVASAAYTLLCFEAARFVNRWKPKDKSKIKNIIYVFIVVIFFVATIILSIASFVEYAKKDSRAIRNIDTCINATSAPQKN